MPGPEDILQRMLQQNPVVRNNPNNAPILNALEHRDAQSGQQLAQNYINTLGWTGTPRSSKPRHSLDFPKETNNQQNNIRRNSHVRFE